MTPLKKPVVRVTGRPFQNYGPDRERLFVVTLKPGDLLSLRPHRSRRAESEITVELAAIYRWALINRANAAQLDKARAMKKGLAEARDRRRWNREIRGGSGQ